MEQAARGPLPEGVFYDGRGYVDSFGAWSADHPELEVAVEAEMAALKAEAGRRNASLAAQHATAQAEAEDYLRRVSPAPAADVD